jgi:histidine triad (HIT) family protein
MLLPAPYGTGLEPMEGSDCLFCGIVAADVPAQVVDSDDHTVAFMDINPATRGHALVVPRTHSADLFEISDEDLERTMAAARRLARRMKAALDPDGFNVLNSCGSAAWQTVFHFHLHVVPRYEDDPLKLPWVPSEGDPDEIADVADQIRGSGG